MQEQGVTGKMRVLENERDNVPASWASAGIAQARAFSVGNSPVVHKPTHFRPNLVRGKCGIVAPIVESDKPCAFDRDAFPDCPTCVSG